MNDSTTIITKARLIADARTRQVGEKTLVEVPVAYNTYGGKAKERYVDSYIVNITVSGGAAERAARLRKGDTISAVGTIEEREYKGKIYKDMPFGQITIQKAAFLDEDKAAAQDDAPPAKVTAPVNDKGTETNPFANDDLPF